MPPKSAQMMAKLDVIFGKIKRLVIRRGGRNGIRELTRAFRVKDDDDDMCVTRAEFEQAMVAYGINLSAEEIDPLFKIFDVKQNGTLGVLEFLTFLRGKVPPRRKAWITKAWQRLPKTRLDVAVQDLRSSFDAESHPDAMAGKASPQDLLANLAADFSPQTNPSGFVSKEEFEAYCVGLSATIESDEYFCLLMNNVWGLGPVKRTMNSMATMSTLHYLDGQQKLPLERTIEDGYAVCESMNRNDRAVATIDAIGKHIHQRAGGFRGLGREFRLMDRDGNGFLDHAEFIRGIQDYGLPLTQDDMEVLVTQFDCDGDGMINYDEFMFAIRGELPARRKKMVERAFRRFNLNQDGTVNLSELLGRFQVFRNPLVAKGKQTAEEVLRDYTTSFEQSSSKTGRVPYEEFEEYYQHVSAMIENDLHFEIMLNNAWK